MKKALENFDEAGVTAWFVIAAILAIVLMIGHSLWTRCCGFPAGSERHWSDARLKQAVPDRQNDIVMVHERALNKAIGRVTPAKENQKKTCQSTSFPVGAVKSTVSRFPSVFVVAARPSLNSTRFAAKPSGT